MFEEYLKELGEDIQEALEEDNTYEAEMILKEGWTVLHNFIDDVRDACLYSENMIYNWRDVIRFFIKLMKFTKYVANGISEPLNLGDYDDK
jgi:hypothetical protein